MPFSGLLRGIPLSGKFFTDLPQSGSALVQPEDDFQGVLFGFIGDQFTGRGDVEAERHGPTGLFVPLGFYRKGGGGPFGDGFPFPLGD